MTDRSRGQVPEQVVASLQRRRTQSPLLGGAMLFLPTFRADRAEEDPTDYRPFFDMANTGQLVLDRSRRIRRANSSAERLFASGSGQLAGKLFLDLVSPQFHPTLEQAFVSTDADSSAVGPLKVEGLGADRTLIPIEIRLLRVRRGADVGFGVVIRDLRDRPAELDQASTAPQATARPQYTLGELLMANRLKDLV